MNSVWLSLLWKEWCEFRWKLVALTAILGIVPLLTLWGFADEAEGDRVLVLTLIPAISTIPYAVIAGLFVAMSVAAGENSRRTMRFLQATPVPMWEAALAKLLVAIVTVLIPIVVVMAAVWLCVNHFDPTGQIQNKAAQEFSREFRWGAQDYYLGQIAAGTLGAASLLIWGAAAGVNRFDEVRAGAVGFLVMAGVWFAFTVVVGIIEEFTGSVLTDRAVLWFAAVPGGPGFVTRDVIIGSTSNLVMFSVIGILSHAAVLTWFLRRFGRVALPSKRSVAGEWNLTFWRSKNSLPLRTPLGAIIWKQVREIGPLVLFAILGVVCITPLLQWLNRGEWEFEVFSEMSIALTISVGILVTLVSGVGVLLEDYQPKVNTFWRSRPINPHLWFAVKYLTGIVILALAFAPLPIAVNWASGWRYASPLETLGTILFFLAIYTLSMTAFALVRQPIYAVILAMGSLWPIGFLDGWIAYYLTEWLGADLLAIVAGTFLVIVYVAVVLLAWQAVVRDWGWKPHR
jgi:hypothetical protein